MTRGIYNPRYNISSLRDSDKQIPEGWDSIAKDVNPSTKDESAICRYAPSLNCFSEIQKKASH
jgi:hypothetical protein